MGERMTPAPHAEEGNEFNNLLKQNFPEAFAEATSGEHLTMPENTQTPFGIDVAEEISGSLEVISNPANNAATPSWVGTVNPDTGEGDTKFVTDD